MILRLILAWGLMGALAWGEHGATEKFTTDSFQKARQLGNLVDDAQVKFRWLKTEDGWKCVFSDSQGRHAVATHDGKREVWGDGKGEKSIKMKTPSRMKGSGLVAKQGVRITPRVLSKDDWDAKCPEGWVWGDRIRWNVSRKWFVVDRIRDVKVRQVTYVRSSPKDQFQPKTFTRNYPKPGDELRTQVPVIFSARGEKIEVDPALIKDPFSISQVIWKDERRVWLEFIERGFGKYRLLEVDVKRGVTRVVAEETDDKFVHVFQKCGWWSLGMEKLLWRSEQDGWSHLYLVDAKTGERKQLTKGQWVVREVLNVEGNEVIFSLGGYYEKQDPYYLHWAKLNWKTGKMTMLTEANGTHELQWSPTREHYVAKWSRVDHPPVYELRNRSDGSLVTELARASGEKLLQAGFQMPERFVVKDREGEFDIHGLIMKPANFDPSKKYPIIENIYAGPHGAFVPKSWRHWYGHASEMLEAGFVLVRMDGRGTNFRGQKFQQFAYKNIKDSGFPDRIKWIKKAAELRPWMDLSRVGLYGGSAGGQSTLAALIWHGDFYKAGAADCGCHDNRMDKIWWNEQWMDWPIDPSYAANSNTEHVAKLEGDLFLTVGEVDTNVDPASTLQVVDALIKADRDFEFYLIPNGGHGVGEKPYFRRKRVEFFERSLGGAR
ncbi:MAG: prolyl oligopeptidase family serine peptidase [Akkermansiaceae bacterium]